MRRIGKSLSAYFADLTKGGNFVLGFTLGYGVASVLFVFAEFSDVLNAHSVVPDITIGIVFFVLGLASSHFYAAVAARQRALDKKVQITAAMSKYPEDAVIERFLAIAVSKEGQLKRIPLERLAEGGRAFVASLDICTHVEWHSSGRDIKNYFKGISQIVEDAGFSENDIKDAVERGSISYFYHLWAMTLYIYYTAPKRLDGDINESSFQSEVNWFRKFEPFLPAYVRSKKGEFNS